ncbi:hypothetical protein E3N88_28592 [Mikania micrantha]|uniref:BED-type domain-containing protein n=1 Tax=Mikania micrantha TaxID=192012 RepID=A0A5N6N0G4_9ASTR|nr:hypothetical protein E3N88_28592 [Mikania micrantha]
MSNVSCSGPLPLLADEDQYLDHRSPFESTEFQSSADTPTMENNPNVVLEINDEDARDALNATFAGAEEANAANNDEPDPFSKRKRKKTSVSWEHFREVTLDNGTIMHECIHCGEKVKKFKDGTTTPMNRHIKDCSKLQVVHKSQLKLNVLHGKSDCSSAIQNWKFDNSRMREVISHMIMVHELPFNFVEYDLFNVVMKEANPAFNKISRASIRQDCISSYEIGRKRIQKLLNTVNRVSITTDMWTSIQNIHYMVVTCHFVDSDFKLHKCILNFVDIPPPYSGVRIYDCLFKCLKEWKIETKVSTLTVDNARTNDVVALKLKENLNLQKNLAINGSLFHVRCCAHILNLLVQDGLLQIKDIIHNVRESVKHVTASPGRLHLFGELSKQLQKSKKHLILDVSTRWNATYAMLSSALEFKEVFENYADRESSYNTLPSADDWKKVEDVCSFLALFNEATKIISGSEYPTSNLFLSELYGIKEALDEVASDEDDSMKCMAEEMKKKFDKYWGSCNLLISIASILDPRYKLELLDFSFKAMYPKDKAVEEIELAKNCLRELFNEYVETYKEPNVVSSGSENVGSGSSGSGSGSSFIASRFGKGIKTGSAKYDQHIRTIGCIESVKSELTTYLDEGSAGIVSYTYEWRVGSLGKRILFAKPAAFSVNV